MAKVAEPALHGVIAFVVVIGLLGAFAALGHDGFWSDELFTAWVIGTDHNLANAFARMLADAHPPLYYLSLFTWSLVVGSSEAALRAFSAITSTAAVVILVACTRLTFSFPARWFAAAIATTSTFWLYQSQNARSYGLALLIASAMVALALALIRHEAAGLPTRWLRLGLAATVAVGAFVHFYLLVTGVVVLFCLFAIYPRYRSSLAVVAVLITAAALAWIKFVVASHSIYVIGSSWIRNSPGWYVQELKLATMEMVGPAAMLAIGVALAAALLVSRRPLTPMLAGSRAMLAVPPLVLAAGIASSVVLAPNFTDRNMLIASPFIWGSAAWLFDAGVARLDRWRVPVTALIAVLLVVAGFRIERRFDATNEPFRESARWISAQRDCDGATILVLDPWLDLYTSNHGQDNARNLYGHYLRPGIRLQPVRDRDVTTTALPRSTCHVVAWEAHSGGARHDEGVRQTLSRRLGEHVALQVFPVARDPQGFRAAYVFVRGNDSPHP